MLYLNFLPIFQTKLLIKLIHTNAIEYSEFCRDLIALFSKVDALMQANIRYNKPLWRILKSLPKMLTLSLDKKYSDSRKMP